MPDPNGIADQNHEYSDANVIGLTPLIAAAPARRTVLVQEHRDLDDTIALLAEAAVPDDALMTRLKKRKLRIKDAIVRLDSAEAA